MLLFERRGSVRVIIWSRILHAQHRDARRVRTGRAATVIWGSETIVESSAPPRTQATSRAEKENAFIAQTPNAYLQP